MAKSGGEVMAKLKRINPCNGRNVTVKYCYKFSFYLFFLLLSCANIYAFPNIERNKEESESLVSQIIPTAKEVEVVEVATIKDLENPKTLEEKFSYAYSYLLYLSTLSQNLDIDVKYYAKGAMDAAEGKALYSQDEIMQIIQEMQQEMLSKAILQQEEIAKENLRIAEEFLEVNSQNDGIIQTESGLQFKILTAGEGINPKVEDKVVVRYQIYTMVEQLLLESEEDTTIELYSLVPGFVEGISLMNKGAKYRFFVHPKLAYGKEGTDEIPPNTLLIFDVELIDILDN